MAAQSSTPSARQTELLELAYAYACRHGLSDLSLRPLAAAIGSSPRVLMFLFGTKAGLVRALLARARADELALLDRLQPGDDEQPGMDVVAERVWAWLSDDDHRALLRLWVEGYARSLVDPHGAWAGFARTTVTDWLAVLATAQPPAERDTPTGAARRSAALAVLRGALLDLLATGDLERTTAAVHLQLQTLATPANPSGSPSLNRDPATSTAPTTASDSKIHIPAPSTDACGPEPNSGPVRNFHHEPGRDPRGGPQR